MYWLYWRKPETYMRPAEPVEVKVNDITCDEEKYTLDSYGFQIYNHESKEKEFQDEETIKNDYYPEIEKLLKDVYVSVNSLWSQD